MERVMVMVVAQPTELAVFDLDVRLERACELIVDAGQAGAQWIIFPEAYLPGAPSWIWSVPHDDASAQALHAMVLAATVIIPGGVSDRLCRVALRSRVGVAIGLVERDHDSYYSSVLFIDEHGRIYGHYRGSIGSTSRQHGWSRVASTTPVQMEQVDVQQEWAGGI